MNGSRLDVHTDISIFTVIILLSHLPRSEQLAGSWDRKTPTGNDRSNHGRELHRCDAIETSKAYDSTKEVPSELTGIELIKCRH